MNKNELLSRTLDDYNNLINRKEDMSNVISLGLIFLDDVIKLWGSIENRRYSDVDIHKELYRHVGYANDHIARLVTTYPRDSLVTKRMLFKEVNKVYDILLEIKDKYFKEQ